MKSSLCRFDILVLLSVGLLKFLGLLSAPEAAPQNPAPQRRG